MSLTFSRVLLGSVFLVSGMMVDGLTGINVVVLEKRFQLSSREIGFIASSNVILGIVLICFVSFYGTYSNKPKWLGLGSLMTGD